MTNYSTIYPGATYLLDPNYNFTGYRIPAGELGATTSIQTANQLKEVNNLLNQGMKTTEISVIQPEVFEMMPKQHLKEIARLNKLTGAESTMHAPIIDPSGFTEQGWNEENREATERQFTEFVKRSHDLDPEGNIPVTIHASSIPGTEMIPETHKLVRPEEKGKGPVTGRMIAVDQQTGQFIPLEREKMYGPSTPEGVIQTPEEKLKMANDSKWIQSITNLAFYKKEADEILSRPGAGITPILEKLKRGEDATQQEQKMVEAVEIEKIQKAQLFLDNVRTSFRTLYEQAAKYPGGDEKSKQQTKKILNNISQEWKKSIEQEEELSLKEQTLQQSHLLDNSINQLRLLGSGFKDKSGKIHEIASPQQYKKVEDFAREKASETLSNVALNTYKEFGEDSPIISIENPPYGSALASGTDLKNLIIETRKKFIKKLKDEGTSTSEATKAAENLIGATWDTSHINMMRKQGFKPEQITKETKEIAPYVKHVHLNDNFGHTHTDLPAGMGSAPISEIMKELEKAKFKGKKIFEGGNFFQHFQTSPFPYQLESSGSQISATGGPYWNQVGMPGIYYSGMGPINPSIHHSIYQAGFTSLPVELGGEMPGTERGRLAQAA